MSTDNTPGNPPEDTPDRATGHDAPRPPRRRPRPALVAASVAAAVLLAGGGGAYWASTASDDGGATSAAGRGDPPPLQLDGYGQPATGAGTGGGGSPEGSAGIAPGEPDPQGARYRAAGPMPDGPDSAPVYRVQGDVSRAQAERLAHALGVRGTPRLVDDTWKFGLTRDASGPTLDVAKKAPGTWTYARYGMNHPGGPGAPNGPDGGGGEGGDGSGPVSEQAAKKAAAPVLKGAGLGGAKLDATPAMGAVRIVNADPVVGGLPTYGWQTGLQIGPDGQVVGGSGHLAGLKKGPDYPVMGAGETLKLLNEASGGGRVGIGGCASAAPHDGGQEESHNQAMPCAKSESGGGGGEMKAQGQVEGRAEGGPQAQSQAQGRTQGPDQPEPKPVAVRKAVFGLAVHFVAGKQALVPSWMYEVAPPGAKTGQSTFTVTQPAVQQKYIARQPAPGGGGTGDQPTSGPAKPGGGKPVHLESYGVDGRTLTLRFWGGVCSDYSATADTSAPGKVKVEVTGKDKKPGQMCIKIAKRLEEKVTLDRPLGDRSIVDAATGKAVAQAK